MAKEPRNQQGRIAKIQAQKVKGKGFRKKKHGMGCGCLVVFGGIAAFFVFIALLLIVAPFLLFSTSEKMSPDYTPPATGLCYVNSQDGPAQMDASGSTYFWPVPTVTRISSQFGPRNSPVAGGSSNHKGIDISIAGGGAALHPFYSVADGTVIYAGAATGYGQVIYVQHAGGLVTKYGHIDSNFEVHKGDAVKKGQRIGRIGAGIVGSSTGPHLHFQTELNGSPVNPLQFVTPGKEDGIPKATTPMNNLPSVCTSSPILNAGNVDVTIGYQPLNIEAMHAYLSTRNGVGTRMGDINILQMVDRVAKKYGIDPYLLLAITGAEQSFVPNNNKNASRIILNPWNTFGSWQNTNNSTEISAEYAAKTIVKLQAGKPDHLNAIQWMNQPAGVNPKGYYAADPNWANNVSVILQFLYQKGGVDPTSRQSKEKGV